MPPHNAAVSASAHDVQLLAIQSATHRTELNNLKEDQKRVEAKLDKLMWLAITSLGGALLQIVVTLAKH